VEYRIPGAYFNLPSHIAHPTSVAQCLFGADPFEFDMEPGFLPTALWLMAHGYTRGVENPFELRDNGRGCNK
jgi:hypothetical protein